jgi:predicted enzyme related to lactoylglutathione lyase
MILDSIIFYTHSLESVKLFYLEVVGLKLDYEQPKTYVSFWINSETRLGIKGAKEEREIPGSQTAMFQVDDPQIEYEKYKSKQVVFSKELTEQSWGKEFSILDPDGNKLIFVERK